MSPAFVRPRIAEMAGYSPGEQPSPGERVVKLNTNENPFPPSERVLSALREMDAESLRRYPNPNADAFRDAAGALLDVSPDMILCGNGSDDILTIATRTFLGEGGRLAYPDPTYSLYPILASLQGASGVAVPWEKDWALPIDALAAAKPDAIYLANPNAPSGTFVAPTQVAALARAFDGLLLIDEAYVDFADDNCLSLVHDHDNVVISRTLSKSYALAGVRFGFAVAQKQVIAEMMKVKDSYNCDAIATLLATAAITDQEHARRGWEYVRSERRRLSAELTTMGWTVLDSHANFILATVPDGRGRDVYEGLKGQGILIRYFDKPGLSDKIRITVGLSTQNNALLAGIKALTEREPQEPARTGNEARAGASKKERVA